MTRFQFSLRVLLVLPVVVGAFLAGERYGRVRERHRLNSIRDIADEIDVLQRNYEGERMPPEAQVMLQDLIDERKALGWN
jgi:hypothetical protein